MSAVFVNCIGGHLKLDLAHVAGNLINGERQQVGAAQRFGGDLNNVALALGSLSIQ